MIKKYFKNRGLNFSIAKYKIISKNSFVPHLRPDMESCIPFEILNNFSFDKTKDAAALIKIKSKNENKLRIKKLMKDGNSLTVSLAMENNLKEIEIEVIDIKNTIELQKRLIIPKTNIIPVASIIPTYTCSCSLPCDNAIKISPIYLFTYNNQVIAGTLLGRKNILFKEDFELNELASAAIGLYQTEGGKVVGSFTNSQPKMINAFLDFIEAISSVNRENLTASINCNYNMSNKKVYLERFWKDQTGICKFHNKLHLNNRIASPNGILQVYLNSIILKEFLCGMFSIVFQNSCLDYNSVIRGVLSGDGSPIQQTINYVTHHIATDWKHIKFQENFIKAIFNKKVSKISKINDSKIVIYNNWEKNLDFLFIDPYRFNIFNRLKFARRFINLETTKFFVNLQDGEIVKGIDIARNKVPIKSLTKFRFITLKEISPKPNKAYSAFLTEKGMKKQQELKDFICHVFPTYTAEVEEFHNTLKKYSLI